MRHSRCDQSAKATARKPQNGKIRQWHQSNPFQLPGETDMGNVSDKYGKRKLDNTHVQTMMHRVGCTKRCSAGIHDSNATAWPNHVLFLFILPDNQNEGFNLNKFNSIESRDTASVMRLSVCLEVQRHANMTGNVARRDRCGSTATTVNQLGQKLIWNCNTIAKGNMQTDRRIHNAYQISHEKGIFSMPVRVYNQDIDSGRVVFMANYLKFMEQARTEWLRVIGINHRHLERHHRVAFVVRDLNVQYLRPAYLDDLLTSTVRLEELGRSGLVLHQTIVRDQTLCEARIRTVCVGVSQFRPVKIPPDVRKIFEDEYLAQSGSVELENMGNDINESSAKSAETVA
jgi:acyl-CoA thioester hydrolase